MSDPHWLDTATRTGRYLRTLGSSLVLFASATFYSLGVVPLVLAYADSSTLGLWILINQIGIWLGAVDLGLSASSIRFFVAPVKQRNFESFRAKFQVALFLAGLQGLTVAMFSFAGPWLGALLSIPASQQELFSKLLIVQAITLGISFCFRPFASILLAAQRYELNYLGNAITFFLSLVLAWLGLRKGWGLWSLMAGTVLQSALTVLLSIYGVWRLGFLSELFKKRDFTAKSLIQTVSESLSFAVGPTAVIGGGLLQSVFLSRCFGLEMVAVWNVGAKAATVLSQILSKLFESSFSGLSELLEAGLRDRMFNRFGQLLGWSMVFCAGLALILLVGNDLFIRVWTHGKINWPLGGTIAVTLMLLVGTLHRALAEATKILVLWNPIRFGPLLDIASLFICLAAAFWQGGFEAFVFAVALGPFLGGLVGNYLAIRKAAAIPLVNLIPPAARVLFVILIVGGILTSARIIFH